MASNEWQDASDLCTCTICLGKLVNPKQLPCLHRFCKKCLEQHIKQEKEVFMCPECKEENIIPTAGVDIFKTDIFVKNTLKLIKLHESPSSSNDFRECVLCTETKQMTAYCFTCTDFLCDQCHSYHIKSRALKDHTPCLSLKNVNLGKLSITQVANLIESPRCRDHPENVSQLYCTTCQNVCICKICLSIAHMGHNAKGIKSSAKDPKDKLRELLKDLNHIYVNNMDILPKRIEIATAETKIKHRDNTNILRKSKEDMNSMFETLRKEITEKGPIKRFHFADILKDKLSVLHNIMEHEIQEIRTKYGELCEQTEKQIHDQQQQMEISLLNTIERLNNEYDIREKSFSSLIASVEHGQELSLQNINNISGQVSNTIKRYENLNATARIIFVTANDCTLLQYIPDICDAIPPLILQMKHEFQEIEETVSNVPCNFSQSLYLNNITTMVNISQDLRLVLNLEVIVPDQYISDITSLATGDIIICGFTSNASHVSVVDINGKLLRGMTIKNDQSSFPWHYCATLSQYKVVLISRPDKIGIYDALINEYSSNSIINIIKDCPPNLNVSCASADQCNQRVVVGFLHSSDFYIFDKDLNHCYTLTVEDVTGYLADITISRENIIICCLSGKKIFRVNMQGIIEWYYEIPKVEGRNCKPLNICSDKRGFIYILWQSQSGDKIITQYSYDYFHVLSRCSVNKEATVITTVEVNHNEKLVITTHSSGGLYSYRLLPSEK